MCTKFSTRLVDSDHALVECSVDQYMFHTDAKPCASTRTKCIGVIPFDVNVHHRAEMCRRLFSNYKLISTSHYQGLLRQPSASDSPFRILYLSDVDNADTPQP